MLFDQVIDIAKGKGCLVVVETDEDRQTAYQAVNHAILNEAVKQGQIQSAKGALQESQQVQAVIAWNGQARGPRDLTLHFADVARLRSCERNSYVAIREGKRIGSSMIIRTLDQHLFDLRPKRLMALDDGKEGGAFFLG